VRLEVAQEQRLLPARQPHRDEHQVAASAGELEHQGEGQAEAVGAGHDVPVPAASQERVDHLCRREPASPRDGPAEDAGALGQVLHVHHVGVERVRELDVVAARAFTRLGLPFEVGTGFLSDPGRDHDEAAVVHHVGRYDRPWCDRSTAGLGPGAGAVP
jgi:hypothetical protein